MKIHHSRMASGFARLPNETLRDERLSLAARGHLAYLLSLPDGWNTTADAESKRARSLRGKRGEGRDAMRRIYAELKESGYVRYVRTQDNGTWSTEIHVFDRPATDVRLTDVPESRMSVPPAEMPERDDYESGEFPQVAPMYGSPGVGSPAVGTPVHRQAVHSYEDRTTEDVKDEPVSRRVGDGVDDWGVRGNRPRNEDRDQDPGQEQPNANSQDRRVHIGPETAADDERRFPSVDPDSATAGSYARAHEATDPATGHSEHAEPPAGEPGGAAAPLSEPAKPARSDAIKLGRWRSPQQIAAEQAAESRARREAAERQAAAS